MLMVKAGTFRADLFYRLSVVPIDVPRCGNPRGYSAHRPPSLRTIGTELLWLSAAAMAALQNYSWPGNVRELRNVLERAAVLCGDREIYPENLRLPKLAAPKTAPPPPSTPAITPLEPTSAAAARTHLKDMERQMILDAMARNQNNKAAVARELGIPLSTLKRRLKEYLGGDDE
ncbi:MAG: helix-turn-helix domain-containing protein [Candidatus Competibacteraceae bacterium]